ncbi:MAG: apolipoprotein N-acyltransferase [Sphingomicrobium sp.]
MNFLLALFAGAASAFAFHPVGWWPLMIVAVAALCELVARAGSLRKALLVGWGFGLGQFAVGLNWIATAFTFQAAMPAWLGWVAVLLVSLYLAVYPAMTAGLAWRFGKTNRLALILALAGSWTITEWLRATMFTGFAWNPIGVSLVDTPWRGVSATLGTYGLSALVAATGGALWLAVRRAWVSSVAIAVVIGLTLTLPAPRAEDIGDLRVFDVAEKALPMPVTPPRPTQPPAPPAVAPSSPPPTSPGPSGREDGAGIDPGFRRGLSSSIRIVQPNIGQQDKWQDGFADEAARRLSKLSTKSVAPGASPPNIIFWPEAAVTEPLADERVGADVLVEPERQRAARNLLAPGAILVTGGLGLTSSNGRTVDGATNSVFALRPDGGVIGRYDKGHLVPYGEYLPMRPLLSAIGLSRLAPGDLDFAPGPGPRTIDIPGIGKMGFQLCYEIIFSGEVVDPANRPNFIFNPSNDAWFGRWGPPQHLAQARLRAAEEALPIIRSTPTGISAVIDATGAVRASIPWKTAGVIDSLLPLPAPPTLFARLGNIIPLSLGFLLLIAAIALGRRARYSAI